MKRYSRKREAILEVIRQTHSHPTAEWIYNKLKPDFSDLSLATVYRNLKEFAASGEINSVGIINSKEHFDGNMKPHCHFICDMCGAVFDVPLPDTDSLDSYAGNIGFGKVTRHSITFRGICNACLNNTVDKT